MFRIDAFEIKIAASSTTCDDAYFSNAVDCKSVFRSVQGANSSLKKYSSTKPPFSRAIALMLSK
jgi:hypothetical protein